jgi:hypothetical protein
MSMKLGFDTSFGIVLAALKDMFPNKSAGTADRVAQIIPDAMDRDKFLTRVEYLLITQKNARIEKNRIQIHSPITFEDLTREIILWSALPGNPSTPNTPGQDPGGPIEDEAEEQSRQQGKKADEAKR